MIFPQTHISTSIKRAQTHKWNESDQFLKPIKILEFLQVQETGKYKLTSAQSGVQTLE